MTPLNQNTGVLRSSNPNPIIPQAGSSRLLPALPPRPNTTYNSNYMNNSYMPYSGNMFLISNAR